MKLFGLEDLSFRHNILLQWMRSKAEICQCIFASLKKLLAYRINNSDENRSLEKVETVTLSQKYVVIPVFTVFISSCSILKPAGTENEVLLL